MSDLFGNHIVGFPTRWLICKKMVSDKAASIINLSGVVRKSDLCLWENKGADQLCRADQLICFCYMDSTTLPLPIPKMSRF